MEQLLTFIAVVFISVFSILVNFPELFALSFIGGLIYYKVVGHKKGWELPKEVKKRHQW
jgi:hypothetical protein